ncbi:ATP-binding protein [Sphingomonas morindae]|uniref:histidine kinase n=1 Tax=Sphingomonas morindae TaxID=1541170 RepID=A0ABY4X8B7_9SPHN|nr:ATP-binding protein [Sphingomonas morindae]USI73193.1 response regulator [Sphingomonas morindae]
MAPGERDEAMEAPQGGRYVRLRDSLSWAHGVLLFFAIIAAAVVIVLVVRAGRSNSDRDNALARERHSYEVVLAARAVEASMASAEAALGRFAISADRTMGATYYNDWVLAGAQIDRLDRLVAADPEERRLAARLRALYGLRSAELGLPATSAAAHHGWAALNQFNAVGHSDNIAAIDQVLADIRGRASDLLAHRYDQSNSAAVDSNHFAALLSLAGLALIVAAGGLGWAVVVALGRRHRAETEAEEAAGRADWLREAVSERTQELSEANSRLQREIADRATAEAQLRQMQKMDAVGQLTGGIAHDFNNMLAVVVGSLDLARRRAAPGETRDHIDRALDGAHRAAALTRRLLGFARAEALLPESIEPATLLAGMTELLDRTLGERIRMDLQVAPDAWPIWCDPTQLENAVLNLAVNARDAMDGAGPLTICAENCVIAAGEAGDLPAGDYVRVTVADQGSGMTPDVVERAFEPFFTTKPIGKGTGLGLSQIFGFVRQSGGHVTIDTAPGRGTSVSLYLPRATKTPRAAPRPSAVVALPRPPAPAPAAPADRPVLVVEDDARVRAATCAALVELGYAPISCDSAEAALAELARHPALKVMLTDVIMPGLTGTELARQVRTTRPDLAILFVTGYAGEDSVDLRGETVLHKPFTLAALDRAVADSFALSAPSPAPGAVAAA